MASNFYQQKQLDKKTLIFNQIERINSTILNFAPAPTTINAVAGMYDTAQASQQGKRIANGILCLEALISRDITKEFMENEQVMKARKKAFQLVPVRMKNMMINIKRYSSEDLHIQQEGIEDLLDYYQGLCAFIFSMPEFSTAKLVSPDDMIFEEGEEDANN